MKREYMTIDWNTYFLRFLKSVSVILWKTVLRCSKNVFIWLPSLREWFRSSLLKHCLTLYFYSRCSRLPVLSSSRSSLLLRATVVLMFWKARNKLELIFLSTKTVILLMFYYFFFREALMIWKVCASCRCAARASSSTMILGLRVRWLILLICVLGLVYLKEMMLVGRLTDFI